jgi:hypothetical protein
VYYAQKKSRVLVFDSAVATIAITAATTDAQSIAVAVDLWSVKTNGTMRMPAVCKMTKYQCL